MNAHQSISYRDQLIAANKARRKRLGFDGKPEPVEKKIVSQPYVPDIKRPEWRTMRVHFDEHVTAWRDWNLKLNRFFGSPLKTYVLQRSGELGQTYDDVVGISRVKEIAYVRQIIMWEIKHWIKPEASLPEIGRLFGGRDHTTVLHALRKIDAIKAKGGLLTHDIRSIFPKPSPRRAQNAVLEFIRRTIHETKTPPTAEQISAMMGWKCKMTAYNILARLEKDGKIIRPTCFIEDLRLA